MHKMRIWSAAGVIAVVLVIGFVLSVPHLRDAGSSPTAQAAAPLPTVYLHDSYKKGVYTIGVEVAAPTPCTIVSGQANDEPSSASSTPDTIAIAIQMPADTGVCLQEPATTTFSYSVSAGAEANLVASINGNNASTSSY